MLAGDRADLADRLERAGDVAGVGDGDQAGFGADGLADVVGVDQAGPGIDRDARLGDPAQFLHGLQRAEDGVVVDAGADAVGLLALLELMQHQPFDGEVQAIGAVEREDEMLGPLAVEKLLEALAAFGQDGGGFDRLAVRAAAGRGADFGGVTAHCLEHRRRLGEARGGIVHVQPANTHKGKPRILRQRGWFGNEGTRACCHWSFVVGGWLVWAIKRADRVGYGRFRR